MPDHRNSKDVPSRHGRRARAAARGASGVGVCALAALALTTGARSGRRPDHRGRPGHRTVNSRYETRR